MIDDGIYTLRIGVESQRRYGMYQYLPLESAERDPGLSHSALELPCHGIPNN